MPVSIGKSTAFNDVETIETGHVELSSVEVVIDQVPDNEIASQIELLAINYLNSSPFNTPDLQSDNKINLKIHVVQRSYLQGTSMVNSIFFSFAFSEIQNNSSVCVINEFTSGEKTIYSSKIQQKFLNKALNEYFKQKTAKKK